MKNVKNVNLIQWRRKGIRSSFLFFDFMRRDELERQPFPLLFSNEFSKKERRDVIDDKPRGRK